MKQCNFCNNSVREIDYKNVEVLREYLDTHSRILRHNRTGTCSKHQRQLGTAIKRARFMVLLPFVQG